MGESAPCPTAQLPIRHAQTVWVGKAYELVLPGIRSCAASARLSDCQVEGHSDWVLLKEIVALQRQFIALGMPHTAKDLASFFAGEAESAGTPNGVKHEHVDHSACARNGILSGC